MTKLSDVFRGRVQLLKLKCWTQTKGRKTGLWS